MIGGRDGRVPITAAGAAVIGTSAILIKASGLDPVTVAFFRSGYAVPALAVFAVVERVRRGARSRRSHLCSLGAGVLFGATTITQNIAISEAGAAIATVLSNTHVLFVTVAAWLLWRQRPSARFAACLGAALIGVLLVSEVLGGATATSGSAAGVGASLLTAFLYAGFLLMMRTGQQAGDPHVVGPMLEVVVVSAMVALIAGTVSGSLDLAPSWPAHGWLLLLALGPQVVGWLVITAMMRELPVALAALLLLIQPLVAVLLGVVVFDELLSWAHLLGSALILGAATVASRSPARQQVREPEPRSTSSRR